MNSELNSDGFDRIRPRRTGGGDGPADPLGRRVLFGVVEQQPALGAVLVACSACGKTSAVTPLALLALAVPSLHLPLLRRGHPSWMRCPACRRRAWVRLGVQL